MPCLHKARKGELQRCGLEGGQHGGSVRGHIHVGGQGGQEATKTRHSDETLKGNGKIVISKSDVRWYTLQSRRDWRPGGDV